VAQRGCADTAALPLRNLGALADRAYLAVFHKARDAAFSGAEAASLLARRPYDLRHAAVSTWLNAGVAPPQVAEWAGHSVDVLLRVYASASPGSRTRPCGASSKRPDQTTAAPRANRTASMTDHAAILGTYWAQPPAYDCLELHTTAPAKLSPRPHMRRPGAVSAGGGRCWVRTNVGLADGFTDRSLWPLGQPASCRLARRHSEG
jgi:hypothetical protein